ncbi:dihydrofolate reductase family protein [bacterium]|nr:dihydrofolate reductase family protein [bacterium]
MGDRPYTYLNMIATLDGKAVVGGAGTTWTVGSDTDHALFKWLRRSCDAVISGAASLAADEMPYPRVSEAERERRVAAGLRPVPLWVVVSGRANLPPDLRLLREGGEDVLVVVSEQAPAERVAALEARARVLRLGQASVPMRALVELLAARFGVRRLYCIGGPTLNAAMLEAGVLDELFMTLAPKIQGGAGQATMIEGAPYPPTALKSAKLLSVYAAGDELFMRYALSEAAKESRG